MKKSRFVILLRAGSLNKWSPFQYQCEVVLIWHKPNDYYIDLDWSMHNKISQMAIILTNAPCRELVIKVNTLYVQEVLAHFT